MSNDNDTKDELIKEFRKIYFYRNKGKKGDDKMEEEGKGGMDYVEQRTVLMDMAKAYRDMFYGENTLAHNRANHFLVLNGFLIAAIAAVLTRIKDIEEIVKLYLLIPVLCVAVVGILSVLKYRREINKSRRANLFLQARWKKFIKTFYRYCKENNISEDRWIFLSRECILPPVLGLSAREEGYAKEKLEDCKKNKKCKGCEEGKACLKRIHEFDYKDIWVGKEDGIEFKGKKYPFASTDTWLDIKMGNLALWEEWIQLDYVLVFLWSALFLVACARVIYIILPFVVNWCCNC